MERLFLKKYEKIKNETDEIKKFEEKIIGKI